MVCFHLLEQRFRADAFVERFFIADSLGHETLRRGSNQEDRSGKTKGCRTRNDYAGRTVAKAK